MVISRAISNNIDPRPRFFFVLGPVSTFQTIPSFRTINFGVRPKTHDYRISEKTTRKKPCKKSELDFGILTEAFQDKKKFFTGCLLFTKIVACSLRIRVEFFIRFIILLESLTVSQKNPSFHFQNAIFFFGRNPTESHGIRHFFSA